MQPIVSFHKTLFGKLPHIKICDTDFLFKYVISKKQHSYSELLKLLSEPQMTLHNYFQRGVPLCISYLMFGVSGTWEKEHHIISVLMTTAQQQQEQTYTKNKVNKQPLKLFCDTVVCGCFHQQLFDFCRASVDWVVINTLHCSRMCQKVSRNHMQSPTVAHRGNFWTDKRMIYLLGYFWPKPTCDANSHNQCVL